MLGFFCVNHNKNVDVKCLQTLSCFLCYNSPILFCNPKIQARKGLIIYNTTNGITTLKKHVNAKHFILAKNVCGRSKQSIKRRSGKTTCQKRSKSSNIAIINSFTTKDPFQKDHMHQTFFFEDMSLLIVKNCLPMQFVESL